MADLPLSYNLHKACWPYFHFLLRDWRAITAGDVLLAGIYFLRLDLDNRAAPYAWSRRYDNLTGIAAIYVQRGPGRNISKIIGMAIRETQRRAGVQHDTTSYDKKMWKTAIL